MNNTETVRLETIVGGGQTIATLQNGKKLFVWGGLPEELVEVTIIKQRSKLAEGIVTKIIEPSTHRIKPLDESSYLSTSPWQIMDFNNETNAKARLIKEAFELNDIELTDEIIVYSDSKQYGYRNKMEFSWWWSKETEELDLAFFKRGSHNKTPVYGSSLAMDSINRAATAIRNLLRQKESVKAYDLKTLLIRSSQDNNISAQLYVKVQDFELFSDEEVRDLNIQGFEIIYSNPKSPASVITKRLKSWGLNSLSDKLLDKSYSYAVEGFFQINLPVYEQVLTDIKNWVPADKPVVDLYSGVGTIGLSINNQRITLVEIDENAHNEMIQNINALEKASFVKAVLAPSEKALEYIEESSTIIVDPPRAGLHESIVKRLLDARPARIVYLSCNPVTQARDIALLRQTYGITWHKGYNFFPRTPHIEHLVILELKR